MDSALRTAWGPGRLHTGTPLGWTRTHGAAVRPAPSSQAWVEATCGGVGGGGRTGNRVEQGERRDTVCPCSRDWGFVLWLMDGGLRMVSGKENLGSGFEMSWTLCYWVFYNMLFLKKFH